MLREMYSRWAFFASTIDLVEMTLAKADRRIAAQYDRLAPAELRLARARLRARLARAVDAVLAVTGHDVLLEANPVLRRSIDVRNPYVDPINLVQVELLRRLRGPDAGSRALRCVRRHRERHRSGHAKYWMIVLLSRRRAAETREKTTKIRKHEESKSAKTR